MVLLDDVPYTLKQRYNWYVLHKNYADRNERSCEILRKIVFLPGVCKLLTPTVYISFIYIINIFILVKIHFNIKLKRVLPPTFKGKHVSALHF